MAVVLFLSDLFFAFVPLTFIHRLRRPLCERVFIGAVLTIGLFAVATSIAKLYLLYQFWYRVDPKNDNYKSIDFLVPTWMEVYVSIIGATVPCLASLLMTWMRKCGFMGKQTSNIWGLGGRIDLADVDIVGSADKSTSGDGSESQGSEWSRKEDKVYPSDHSRL
jgi:hypothetical protein